MTDVEINKALALAIGWKEWDIIWNQKSILLCFNGPTFAGVFDYTNWNVIGPIAESYDCFPYKIRGKWDVMNCSRYYDEDTPQKAIAMAVIHGSKK